MTSSGLTRLNETPNYEINQAVNSIIMDHDYSNESNNGSVIVEPTSNVGNPNSENDNKRKREAEVVQAPDKELDKEVFRPNPKSTTSPESKKTYIAPNLRLYGPHNRGPYEVVIQHKEKTKLNPFQIGKTLKTHHEDIDYINRAGRNLSIVCKTFLSANNFVMSKEFNVFIPSIGLYTVGVIYIEPKIHEDEIVQEDESQFQIIPAVRITRYINREFVNTHFAKITFESDKLPEYITLNYVRIPDTN